MLDTAPPPGHGAKVPEPLGESVTHILEEARMLIPGVTAFLGFQLIAVFSQGFTKLDHNEQVLHLVAMFLMIVSLLLLLTPATYHRQVESGWVSQGFVNLSSRLLTAATPAFALGITADFYLLVRFVVEDRVAAAATAVLVLAIAVALWYAVPHVRPLALFLRGERR
jgi:hypothetical protein